MILQTWRCLACRGAAVSAALVAVAVTVSTLISPDARAQEGATSHRAGLVVRFGDGSVQDRCVTFEEPAITGLELLERSGFSVSTEVSSMGTSVCSIGDEGCPGEESCYCRCETVGADCLFWSYQLLEGGVWTMAETGPTDRQVTDGSVDGWAWGPGSESDGADLPPRTFESLCADAPTASGDEGIDASGGRRSTAGLVAAAAVAVGLLGALVWLRRG